MTGQKSAAEMLAELLGNDHQNPTEQTETFNPFGEKIYVPSITTHGIDDSKFYKNGNKNAELENRTHRDFTSRYNKLRIGV